MSRYKPLIERGTTDRIELKRIVQNPLSDPDLILRANAILSFLDGLKGDVIARNLNVRPNTVSDWRKRYEENGVEGLYAKAPKGKRGSDTRNKVLEMLETQPPEGGWSTKALADAVGTSLDTVRRALKDEHMTASKSYIWDREIQHNPAMVCVNAIGLYMSKEEAGLILRIDSQMNAQSSGFVTTRNRKLAQTLDQLIRTDDGVSLVDAIRISVQEMKEVYRGSKEVFQDFAGKLLRESDRQTACERNSARGKCFYYILYWYESSTVVKPILQESSTVVKTTEDIDVWVRMIEPWIGITSQMMSRNDNGGEAEALMSLIDLYMNQTTTFVEPFEWRRSTV